jgi:transposase InsO family protein
MNRHNFLLLWNQTERRKGRDYAYSSSEAAYHCELLTTRDPGDNPVNKAFFSHLKAEWGEQFVEAETFDALYQLVSRAIAYYNTERYHTSIGCQTPAQFTRQFLDHLALESP